MSAPPAAPPAAEQEHHTAQPAALDPAWLASAEVAFYVWENLHRGVSHGLGSTPDAIHRNLHNGLRPPFHVHGDVEALINRAFSKNLTEHPAPIDVVNAGIAARKALQAGPNHRLHPIGSFDADGINVLRLVVSESLVAVGGDAGDVALFDSRDFSRCLSRWKAHDQYIAQMAFSPLGGEYLLTAGHDDRLAKIWCQDLDGGSQHLLLAAELEHGLPSTKTTLSSSVFSKKGHLATATNNKDITIWSVGDWAKLRSIAWTLTDVERISFSNDATQLLATSKMSAAKIFAVPSGEVLRSINIVPSFASCWDPIHEHRILVAAAGDNHPLLTFDARTGEPCPPISLSGHKGEVRFCSFAAGSAVVVSSAWTTPGEIMVWDLENESVRRTETRGARAVISPDERLFSFSPANIVNVFSLVQFQLDADYEASVRFALGHWEFLHEGHEHRMGASWQEIFENAFYANRRPIFRASLPPDDVAIMCSAFSRDPGVRAAHLGQLGHIADRRLFARAVYCTEVRRNPRHPLLSVIDAEAARLNVVIPPECIFEAANICYTDGRHRIGQGGFANIRTATIPRRWNRADPSAPSRIYAVKDYNENSTVADQIKEFVRSWAASSHINIVNTVGIVLNNSSATVAVVMELAEMNLLQHLCPDLKDHPSRVRKLPYSTIYDYCYQLADGLAHLHSMGIMHLDFSPVNILVSQLPSMAYRIRITDFGISHLRGGEGTDDSLSCEVLHGNRRWICPEHNELINSKKKKENDGDDDDLLAEMEGEQRSRKASENWDTYSYGCILFLMLMAELPTPDVDQNRRMLGDHLPSDCPKQLKLLALSCLQRDPNKRPRHGGEILAKLDEMRQHHSGRFALLSEDTEKGTELPPVTELPSSVEQQPQTAHGRAYDELKTGSTLSQSINFGSIGTDDSRNSNASSIMIGAQPGQHEPTAGGAAAAAASSSSPPLAPTSARRGKTAPRRPQPHGEVVFDLGALTGNNSSDSSTMQSPSTPRSGSPRIGSLSKFPSHNVSTDNMAREYSQQRPAKSSSSPSAGGSPMGRSGSLLSVNRSQDAVSESGSQHDG